MNAERTEKGGVSRYAFAWNADADQPHNVAPRSERTAHHFRHAMTYLSLAGSNLIHGPGIGLLYRRYFRAMFQKPVLLRPEMFAVSVSPSAGREDEVLALLRETGGGATLIRVASWDRERLASAAAFAARLREAGFRPAVAVLQRREDVFRPQKWRDFLNEVFSRFAPHASVFEIGHAWNRTKWGVWDHTEYLRLARAAVDLRAEYGVKLAGPAVIDFEFHLLPPVLRAVDFDVVSSLLYVDRVGAPEKAQFGWTAEKKFALLKACIDAGGGRPRPCWVTEVNWPLQGTGPYSPASGRPNVSEEEQADFLIRYYIPALASGLIERVYWWQLAAPGYGLVDSRGSGWRRRPSFLAFRTMAEILGRSEFVRRENPGGGEAFFFRVEGGEVAVLWTAGKPFLFHFSAAVERIQDRDGGDLPPGRSLLVEGRPRFVFFRT